MKKLIILILLIMSAGCARGPVAPAWLDAEPSNYLIERYLSGRGQGEMVGLARDRARADLAKIFEVAIRESSSDRLQWQQGGANNDGLQTSISRDIQLQTSQVISGIQIAETWRATEGGDYHVLAVLDRLQASNRLRTEINFIDAETAQNIERARREETLPEQTSAAYNALDAQLQRDYPQRMLRIVDLTGSGLPPKYQLAELKSDFESLLDRWRIALKIETDELGAAQEILAGALANAGIRHLASEEQADYLLLVNLDAEELTTTDGWHWVRGTLRISLAEISSDNIVGSHQWSYKSSARQIDMVRIRAHRKLVDLLDQELLKVLVEFGDVK